MVTIMSVGLTSPTAIEQERCSSSLMCTEQAPHCATPQPYLVPVRPTCSLITQSSGVSASTVTSLTVPLMLSFATGFLRFTAGSTTHAYRARSPTAVFLKIEYSKSGGDYQQFRTGGDQIPARRFTKARQIACSKGSDVGYSAARH